MYDFTSPGIPMGFILYSLSKMTTCTSGKGAPTGANFPWSRHAFETSI